MRTDRASIESIALKNFRGFQKTERIPLRPLTFLVGPNSSGKSSLFNALLLSIQSEFTPDEIRQQQPIWSGRLVDLGSYFDSVYKHDARKPISIELYFPKGYINPHRTGLSKKAASFPEMSIRFELRSNSKDHIGRLSSVVLTDQETGHTLDVSFGKAGTLQAIIGIAGEKKRWETVEPSPEYWGPYKVRNDFNQWISKTLGQLASKYRRKNQKLALSIDRLKRMMLFYILFQSRYSDAERISSGRIGPKRWYPNIEGSSASTRLSSQYQRYDGVDPNMLDQLNRTSRSKKTVKALSVILEKMEIATQIKRVPLSMYHSKIELLDNVTHAMVNLADVGYGASQSIPVIAGLLSGRTGPLVIEQPEIHLHPRAQGVIGDLIAEASAHRQMIVETHSVHMINRARLMIARKRLRKEDVVVLYVQKNRNGSCVHPIFINENGEFLEEWPHGFFDERYQESMELLALR